MGPGNMQGNTWNKASISIIPPLKLDSGDKITVKAADDISLRIKPFPAVPPTLRRLPDFFRAKFNELYEMVIEKKDLNIIRSAFSETIRVADLVFRDSDASNMRSLLNETWDSFKALQVAQILLGSMITSPARLLSVLELLDDFKNVDFDFAFRADCLMLTAYIHKDVLARVAELTAKFDAEIDKLRSPQKWPANGMRRRHLSLLLWRSNVAQTEKVVSDILEAYPKLSTDNALCLAMSCSHKGMGSVALSILTALPPEQLQSPSNLTLKCCQVLLRHDVVESTPDGPNFRFLPRLLEKGLTPDNVLYSRIIERALDSGYQGVAWDIYHHLQSTRVDITGWTYLLLLSHAFNDNNVAGVQEIMSEIHRRENLYTNLHLLLYSMNIVRRIYLNEKGMTTDESLSHILALYDRVFDREPLARLGILQPLTLSESRMTPVNTEASEQIRMPDAYSLSFTIWAYILCHRTGNNTRALWARIQQMVEQGDKEILECMKHDLIYNALIWLNCRDSRTLASSLEILQYMLVKQFCVPSDRTWSIVICGFLRHGQQAQAKQLFRLMKQHNLSIRDLRQEYWRRGWSFEYFEKNLDEILDEHMMPDGTRFGRGEMTRPEAIGIMQEEKAENFALGLEPDPEILHRA